MDFSLASSLASSVLLFLELDKDLHTRSASSGWNKFCDALPSIDVWSMLDEAEAKAFRAWLRSNGGTGHDLWINYPLLGRQSFRCQKINSDPANFVLQLVAINDIVLDKKLLALLTGLTNVAEAFHDTPKLQHQKVLGHLLSFLRAQNGAFGYVEDGAQLHWLALDGAPPAITAGELATKTATFARAQTTFVPLKHSHRTFGVLALQGSPQIFMTDAGWQLIGQFFSSLCLQSITVEQLQRLSERLTRTQTFLEQTNEVGMIGGWEVDLASQTVFWTTETHRIHGTDPQNYVPNVSEGLQFYYQEHREEITRDFTNLVQSGTGFDRYYQIQQKSGAVIWVRVVAMAEMVRGRAVRAYGIFQNIDKLHKASLKVSEANKTLELVQKASSDGFWDWDLKKNVVYYSARWKTMLGYGVDELPDGYETWKNLIHPDDFPTTQRVLDEHWSKRIPYGHTSRFKHKDGSWRTILVRAHTERDQHDQPVRMLGIHTDITALTELRKEAKDQQLRTNFVMSALGIGQWDWDVDKNELTWDDQLFNLYGFRKEDFTHSFEDWRSTVDPAFLPAAESSVMAALEKGVLFESVFKLKPEHGSKMIKSHGVVVRGADGKPRRLMGINYDVTEEKEIEQELKVFKQLAEMSPDIVGLTNRTGEIIFLNHSAMALGWKSGAQAQTYFPTATLDLFLETILPALKSRGQWEGEVLFRDAVSGEEFPVLQRAFMIRDPQGKVQAIATVGVDLREKRRLEDEIERQRVQFINNSKMSALGEMAGGMAHEINNPLAIIKGNITILRLQATTSEVTKETVIQFLDKQDRTVDRIANIIMGLRSFASDHSQTDFKAFSICDMIRNTLPFCEARFTNNGVRFEHEPAPPDLRVRGRETQLSQAILNILNNAFDAVVGTSDAWIRLRVTQDGTRIKLVFQNSGAGILPEHRDRIMQPFFTTKEVGKGTGLGLPISKGIVETHGGRLYLDGEAPETTFVIELPMDA